MSDLPSHRCSTCAHNWPYSKDFKICPTCGEDTSVIHMKGDKILTVEQARARVLDAAQTPEEFSSFESIHPPQVYAHRYSVFMDMGFGPLESESLANTREDTHAVKKMLAAGCTPDLAVSILL